jgi:hypothetical protein
MSPAASRPRPPRNAIQLRRLHCRGSSPADRCTATKIASSALGLCCGVVFDQSDYAAHHGLPAGTTLEDFTALGDAVNITARLASAAAAGEVIVSVATAEAAGMTTDQLERRTVAIRGHIEPIEVIVLPRSDRNLSR